MPSRVSRPPSLPSARSRSTGNCSRPSSSFENAPYSLMRKLPGFRRLPLPRPGGFAMRISFNGLAQLSPMIANLALTPLLISRLGADRFGIWSLALIVLSTLTSLDGGLSASLARFFAVHAARDDRADAGRLLTGPRRPL